MNVFSVFVLGLILFSCQTNSEKNVNSLADISDTKILQYAIPGKILYESHCANCHQDDGSGLGKLIPPLNPSDYMEEDIERTISLIKNGVKGEMVVNGISYNAIMPANPLLTNMEIAQISTYIYNVWGNKKELIDAKKVSETLKN